jgi:NitT/TauT family transport system permease protein
MALHPMDKTDPRDRKDARPPLREPPVRLVAADARDPIWAFPSAGEPLVGERGRQARPRSARLIDRLLSPVPALVLGIVLIALWQLVTASGSVPSLFLPAPEQVVQAFARSVADGLLPAYAQTTLVESLVGFALGAAIAIPLGYGLAHSALLARALQPYLAASQAIPALALAPLLVPWLGFGLPPVVALCALIVFFPMIVNTTLGLRSLDRDVLDAARVEGAGRWALLRHIELPLALPSILAGVRTSLTLSVTGAVVGEFVSGNQGLGQLLISAASFNAPLEFATLITLSMLAVALYGLARLAERLFSYLEA